MLMLKSAMVVGLNVWVTPMARLLLRVFSAQRSLQRPVPNGSWARLSSFQYENRPNTRLLALMFWSTRATYSSTFPPVLAALTKLFVNSALLVGFGIRPSKNCDVGLMRFAGMMLPANAVRTLLVVAGLGLSESGS